MGATLEQNHGLEENHFVRVDLEELDELMQAHFTRSQEVVSAEEYWSACRSIGRIARSQLVAASEVID